MIKYLIIIILLYLTKAKRIKQSYLIKSLKDWHYISKFGAETGEVFYSLMYQDFCILDFALRILMKMMKERFQYYMNYI